MEEGDRKKMRAALVLLRTGAKNLLALIAEGGKMKDPGQFLRGVLSVADAALAAPARQCDVGTAGEQYARFADACHAHVDLTGRCRATCPFRPAPADMACDRAECFAVWAQKPYEPEP